MTSPQIETATCCVVGGGPAGMMLGFLLARAGVDVVVLEKHADFLRDFRGDTIHPSTLAVFHELGLFEEFRPLLQSEIKTLDVVVGGRRVTPVDFSRLAPPTNFLGLAPQWDLLNFIAEKARQLPTFRLLMSTEAADVVTENGQVRGVTAQGSSGPIRIDADLVVAADGRTSIIRDQAGLGVVETGVPIDVLWFRLEKPQPEPPDTLGYLGTAAMVLTINRGSYYQGGLVVAKGSFETIKAEGLSALRERIVASAPVLCEVVEALTDWDQIKLLTVQVNHAPLWHKPGLLCIGDAAHAMSPVFGVGVNYAIQDAIAAARILTPPLLSGSVTAADLAAVQRRRERPARLMQRIQLPVHRVIARPKLGRIAKIAVRILVVFQRIVQPLAARFIGQGLRPEHVNATRSAH